MQVAASSICAAVIFVGAVDMTPAGTTIERIFEICRSPTMQAAIAKGDALGWPLQTDTILSEWKTAFTNYNGGSVDVVGWQRDGSQGADTLLFWVAIGPNGHQACAYSAKNTSGLLETLKDRLGPPDDLDIQNAIGSTTASWEINNFYYTFVQVGIAADIHITHR